jgi:hypothetical protein
MIKLTSKTQKFLKIWQVSKRALNTQTGRSNLFNNPQLRALRDKIRQEENPLNRYEADVTRMRTVKDDS